MRNKTSLLVVIVCVCLSCVNRREQPARTVDKDISPENPKPVDVEAIQYGEPCTQTEKSKRMEMLELIKHLLNDREEGRILGGRREWIEFMCELKDKRSNGRHGEVRWSIMYQNNPLGIYNRHVVTECGELFHVDYTTGVVLYSVFGFADVIKQYGRIWESLKQNDIATFKALLQPNVEVGYDVVADYESGPLNIGILKAKMNNMSTRITDFRVLSDSQVEMHNSFSYFVFIRSEGEWRIGGGYIRPEW